MIGRKEEGTQRCVNLTKEAVLRNFIRHEAYLCISTIGIVTEKEIILCGIVHYSH